MDSQRRSPPRARLPVLLPADRLELVTWVKLARTFLRLARPLETALVQSGVTPAQFDVLATLATDEGLTQQELAERLLVTKGNVCGVLQRMESLGWVERRSSAEDRRINRLFFTPEGRGVFERVAPPHFEQVRQLMRALTARQQQQLFELLDLLEAGHEG